ncbi:hypothetical protein MNBD_GAMMA10-3256 [hydrothermal vent metagenome]|uniref:Uncharacterized protein n=1 Tax=hydrothermal vent metagenome TaxID=652676 RepID=A0A3B0YE36_9ZZZZ
MTRSVFANGRSFSHKGSGDKSICSAPDVCKTPIGSAVVPIPYPVISQAADANGYSKSVSIDGNPTALSSSTHTQCSGDAPGSAKGIGSSTTGNITHFSSFSFDIKCEGKGVVRHLDTTTMNNRNTVGMVYGTASPSPDIKEEEFPESPQILRFTLQTLPGLYNDTRFNNEPCTLYADGAQLQKALTDDKGTVEWEHKEGTKQYKVKLITGQEFLVDTVEAWSGDKKKQPLQRLANMGFRSIEYKGDLAVTFNARDEAFRRLHAEQRG